jgi:hypothetical protein
MSDGPHKSLTMRAGWKKFAERADKAAFEPDQVAEAIIPALEGDLQEEVIPHLGTLRNVLGDNRQASLFGDANTAELEALKHLNPGDTLWRSVVDCVAWAVADGRTGRDALLDGVTKALFDRGARGVRQVEEHYLRRTDESRARGVRARMEDGMSRAPIEGMARRVLGLESGTASQQPQKLQELDDGVRL